MIMCCFTPSFLTIDVEDEFISTCLARTKISWPHDGDGILLSCNVDMYRAPIGYCLNVFALAIMIRACLNAANSFVY